MKKIRLFLAVLAGLATTSVHAGSDWVPKLATSTPTAGQTYKILNVGAGQYLSEGQAWFGWSTSAVLRDGASARLWTLSGNNTDGWTLACNRSGNNKLFTSGNNIAGQAMHVDGANAGVYFFELQDNGNYRIRQKDVTGLYVGGPDNKGGVLAQVDPANYNCDWAFCTDANMSYNVVIANYADVRTAVLGLIGQTDVYTDPGTAVSTLQDAVYAQDDFVDAAASGVEVNTAIAALRAAATTFITSVTYNKVGTPFDVTDVWITNPAPGISGSLTGWTNSGSPGLEYQLYEYWNVSAGSTKQTLTNLPKGAYGLTAIAFTREGMTATLSAGTASTNIVGVAGAVVNNRNQGSSWIAEGNGSNKLLFGLDAATPSLEIGLVADNATGDHWMCWRSFSLNYYGDVTVAEVVSAEAKEALKAAIAAAKELKVNETDYTEGITAFDAAIATAESFLSSTDVPTLNQAVEDLAIATSAFRAANMFTYQKYLLKNVGAGLYWGAGNDWGTRASLLPNSEYVYLAPQLADGTYYLESQVAQDGYYFNGDYMDQGSPAKLTIKKVGEYYTIANGNNYYGWDGNSTVLGKNVDANSDNAKWIIVSLDEAKAGLSAATQDAPIDATFFIEDHNFGRNNRYVNAWTATGVGNMGDGNVTNFCAETYHADFTLSQVLAGVPNGVYAMTAQGFYRQDGSDNDHLPVFYANDESKTFPLKTGSENSMSGASDSFSKGLYTIDPIFFEVTDGQITLGAKLAGNTNLWCIWDNFTLTYYGTEANIYALKYPYDVQPLRDQALAKKNVENVSEGTKTNIDATVHATAAIPTTKAEYDNEIAQLNAIMAQADKDVNNKPAIDATFDVLNSTNVYTQAAYDAFKAAADDYLAKWNAGTLTEVVPNPSIANAIGWHGDNIIDDYLLSAWTIGGEQAANYDKALYINTWSVEGDNDGTNFKVPFFEYFIGDDNSLAANTIAANVEGLEAGSLYEVSAWVRVRTKNGVAAADATGITMQVGTGTAVDATEGQVIGNSQMSLAEVIARGTADNNGKLTVKFDIAADNNIHWLSFKNVNYGSLSDIYDQTLAAAQALVGTPMEDNAAAALAQTIADYGNVDQADADKVLEAIEKLRDIVAPTQASIDLYKEIAHAIEVVKDQATAEANDLAALDAPYAAGTYHAVQDVFDAYFPIEAQALTSADATDYTSMLVNPSFETGDLTGWEVPAKGADYGVRSAANDTYKMTNSDGDYLFNNWNGSVTTLNLTQTLKDLPVGNYTLTGIVAGYGDESPIIIKANGESREIKPKGDDVNAEVQNGYLFSLPVKVTTGTLAISVENTGKGFTFFKADNFKLGFEPLYELALNDPGTAAFAVKDGTEDITAKKLDHESSEVTADVAAADKAANQVEVNNEKIEHGIQVTYTGVDAVNTEVFECGYRATARLTDSKGNVYQVKTRGDKNTNVINVAEGLFGPNEEYEVVITPIVYYNYDMACDDIYTYWENGKATHQVADPADESWGWDTTTDPATTTKTGVSTILDPAWTLNAAAIEWNQNVLPTLITTVGTPSTDVILFTDCDPLPYYVDYNKHVFYIKTDASVQANVKALAAQDFKAWDAWGNDITAEFLSVNGGTATGIDKVQENTNGAIYNLAGQRVAKTQKGIYVVNGKKVAVK
ncbi:MAG: hypothetical protein IKG77_01615 [Prevotella sp.]|nr:hypothetical protein [Prevotella sp.]MBR3513168.1 hypothetical protein [Bacteroidaceae bacterium]